MQWEERDWGDPAFYPPGSYGETMAKAQRERQAAIRRAYEAHTATWWGRALLRLAGLLARWQS